MLPIKISEIWVLKYVTWPSVLPTAIYGRAAFDYYDTLKFVSPIISYAQAEAYARVLVLKKHRFDNLKIVLVGLECKELYTPYECAVDESELVNGVLNAVNKGVYTCGG